jgi:hypothetical protein
MDSVPGQRAEVSREQWDRPDFCDGGSHPRTVAAQINVCVGVSTAIVCFAPVRAITPRMPGMLRGAQQRRPVLSLAWVVLVLVPPLR